MSVSSAHDGFQKLQVIAKDSKPQKKKAGSSEKTLILYDKSQQEETDNADEKQNRYQDGTDDSGFLGSFLRLDHFHKFLQKGTQPHGKQHPLIPKASSDCPAWSEDSPAISWLISEIISQQPGEAYKYSLKFS